MADPNDKSLLGERSVQNEGDNASALSKCSKSSYGMDNFNSSGPQKVKISTKRLREIKSPLESPRDEMQMTDGNGKAINGVPRPTSAGSSQHSDGRDSLPNSARSRGSKDSAGSQPTSARISHFSDRPGSGGSARHSSAGGSRPHSAESSKHSGSVRDVVGGNVLPDTAHGRPQSGDSQISRASSRGAPRGLSAGSSKPSSAASSKQPSLGGSKHSSVVGSRHSSNSGSKPSSVGGSRPSSGGSVRSVGSKDGLIKGQIAEHEAHRLTNGHFHEAEDSNSNANKPITNNPKEIITLQSTPQSKKTASRIVTPPRKESDAKGSQHVHTPPVHDTDNVTKPVFIGRHTPEKGGTQSREDRDYRDGDIFDKLQKKLDLSMESEKQG